jgi:hypothetical protein
MKKAKVGLMHDPTTSRDTHLSTNKPMAIVKWTNKKIWPQGCLKNGNI